MNILTHYIKQAEMNRMELSYLTGIEYGRLCWLTRLTQSELERKMYAHEFEIVKKVCGYPVTELFEDITADKVRTINEKELVQ